MANQITLGATLLFNGGDGTGGQPDDLSGLATGSTDTSTFLQGSTSYTISASNTRVGMLFDAGSAQNYSNNTFYMTVNSGVVGLMDTKANGGFRMRFCGATVTDFFEVNIGGSDSWPNSIQGGWVIFAVDIETAKASGSRITGGTEPATNAIRYVGFSNLLTAMPKMADNTWFDTLHRLPDGSPGIIIEGRNGGSTDWNAANILTQLGTGQMFYFQGPGGSYVLNTPVQFGINDTTTHGFTGTNAIWLWSNQEFIPDDVYKISALGNSGGTTNITFGSKSGTGINATGSQGFTITSQSTGPRWDMDFDDPNLDSVDFYGCSFSHVRDWQLDDIAVEVINTLFIDTTGGEATNSDAFLKNSYINSSTATDTGTLLWNEVANPDTILHGSSFSKGPNAHHAIDFGANVTSSITLRNCAFTGFGSTNDANDSTVRFLATSGSLTLSLIDCTVDGSPATSSNFSIDDAAGVTVSLSVDPVTTLINIKDETGANEEGVQVYMQAADDTGDLPFEESVSITRLATVATVTHTSHGLLSGEYVKFKGIIDKEEDNSGAFQITVLTANSYIYTTTNSGALTYTGTILATGVTIYGSTDANGNISSSRTYGQDQPLLGYARKSTNPPFYKSIELIDTVNSLTGLTINRRLVLDQ